jgi:hypothetical protein
VTQTAVSKFNADNYQAGFLVDDELMAGITESRETPGTYTAFVVRHTTGETVGVQQFTNLFEAIRTINDIPRPWAFESVKRCGSGSCSGGKCSGGACGGKRKAAAVAEAQACGTGGSCGPSTSS